MQGDISAETMITNVTGVDPARRDRLMRVLDVDPAWRMNRVSDGQRRRVQLAMGLLKPFQVCCAWVTMLMCQPWRLHAMQPSTEPPRAELA